MKYQSAFAPRCQPKLHRAMHFAQTFWLAPQKNTRHFRSSTKNLQCFTAQALHAPLQSSAKINCLLSMPLRLMTDFRLKTIKSVLTLSIFLCLWCLMPMLTKTDFSIRRILTGKNASSQRKSKARKTKSAFIHSVALSKLCSTASRTPLTAMAVLTP